MKKRGYSRDFTPPTDAHGRYLLDKIPADLWRRVRAKAKREGVSVRALILGLLQQWLGRDVRKADRLDVDWDAYAMAVNSKSDAAEFVHHKPDCQAIGGNGDGECECGAVKFLAWVEAQIDRAIGEAQS